MAGHFNRIISLLTVIFMSVNISCTSQKSRGEYHFFVGSGNASLSHPIYLCKLDAISMKITVLDSFPALGGAGYMDLSPEEDILYATSGEAAKSDPGMHSIAAFSVGPAFALTFINRASSKGRGTCHVQTSPDGNYVFAANYSSGDATAIPVNDDGSLAEATSLLAGEGSGPNKQRQEGPHAHQVMMDPTGSYLLVPDLGTDKVMNYVLDHNTGKLSPNPDQPFLSMAPGSGPRHLAFHPHENYVYILGEMAASLSACRFNPSTGAMELINTESIVWEGFEGKRQSAAVRVHPGGKYIYASNRCDESNLAVFELTKGGMIVQKQIVRDIPYWPRDFNLTPDGKFLIVAGARVNELALFKVDEETGKLSPTGSTAKIPGPICILFPSKNPK